MLVKTCKICGKKLRFDNTTTYCSCCYKNSPEYKEKQKQYRLENKEKINKINKQYYKKNKEILNKKSKQYRLKNKDKIAEEKKQYYKKNKEQIKQYQLTNEKNIKEKQKQRYLKNKKNVKTCITCGKQLNKNNKSGYCRECFQKTDICKEQRKQYRLENKDYFNIYSKQYRLENKEKISEQRKQYYKKNKEKIIQRNNKNEKIRKEVDIGFKVRKNVSRSISRYIKKAKIVKKQRAHKYVDIKKIIEHLEAQFDEQMNWNNYGSYWEIDHIIPQSLFDFTDEEQIKLCWKKENLRPLRKKENITKSNKIDIKLILEHKLENMLKEICL